MNQRGFGLIEILLVLVVVAIGGYFLMQYVGSSARTLEKLQQERPIDRSRLAADQATPATLQGPGRNYQAEKGQGPPDKAAGLGPLMAPPRPQRRGGPPPS